MRLRVPLPSIQVNKQTTNAGTGSKGWQKDLTCCVQKVSQLATCKSVHRVHKTPSLPRGPPMPLLNIHLQELRPPNQEAPEYPC